MQKPQHPPAWICALPGQPVSKRERSTFITAHHQRPHRCTARLVRHLQSCLASLTSATPGVPEHPEIAVLPVNVVQRIASGEILHGVDSVVRELVENSLDAGAARVTVDIDTKAAAVTVTDDGAGIPTSALPQAARCNATSKLRSTCELDAGITSLGFRGQGLWAVACASGGGLSIRSRPVSADIGAALAYCAAGDALPGSGARVAMACGTVVRAAGLTRWGGVNARAVRAAREWLARAALVRRSVAFRLSVDGRAVWRRDALEADAPDAAAAALATAYGRPASEFREAAAPVEVGTAPGRVRVAAGLPGSVRAGSARWVVVAVNGRAVSLPALVTAVRSAIALPRGRFPVVLVEISLPPAAVDWNVSPVKSEIRLRGDGTLDAVLQAALAALRTALRWAPSDGANVADTSLVRLVRAAGSSASPGQPSSNDTEGEEDDSDEDARIGWTQFKIVSQLLDTYILVEHEDGVTLVEQHVADERVIYERLLEAWSGSFTELEHALQLPETVSDEQVYNLVSLGFDAEYASQKWELRTGPQVLSKLAPDEFLSDVLKLSMEEHTAATACAKIACDSAVRNGTPLSRTRMRDLVRDLGACADARTCPHGRRTVLPLSARSLAALFGRPLGGALPRTGRL